MFMEVKNDIFIAFPGCLVELVLLNTFSCFVLY